jgi:hypothetical protein
MKPVWIVDDDRSIHNSVWRGAGAREFYKTFASACRVLQALAVSQPQVLVSISGCRAIPGSCC